MGGYIVREIAKDLELKRVNIRKNEKTFKQEGQDISKPQEALGVDPGLWGHAQKGIRYWNSDKVDSIVQRPVFFLDATLRLRKSYNW